MSGPYPATVLLYENGRETARWQNPHPFGQGSRLGRDVRIGSSRRPTAVQDGQVLQRENAGFARALIDDAEADMVTVLDASGHIVTESATFRRADGRRSAEVQLPVGGPYLLRAAAGRTGPKVLARNVLVGDLWVLAGQSNMEGAALIHEPEPPSALVGAFGMDHQWRTAREPLHWPLDAKDSVHHGGLVGAQLAREQRAAREHRATGSGLGLPFARHLVSSTGVPVGLIPTAHGASSIDDWSPDKKAYAGRSLYGALLNSVAGAGGRVAGVLWYQGERDAREDLAPRAAEQYAARWTALIAALRRDLRDDGLPIFIVQLGRFVSPCADDGRGRNRVRHAQSLWRESGASGMASAIDLELDDLIHVDEASLKRLGRRLARLTLGGATPELIEVQASADGRTIRVLFSGVTGGLRSAGRVAGFTIHDRNGDRHDTIFKVTLDPAHPSTVQLRLVRPVEDGYHLWYGHGADPYCTLVDDSDAAVPAFGPVCIGACASDVPVHGQVGIPNATRPLRKDAEDDE